MTLNGKPQIRRGQTLRKTSNSENPDLKKFQLGSELTQELQHQEFTILKTLHSGTFSKIYLARPELGSCKKPLEQALVLKAFNSDLTNAEDFSYELELNYFLSPHPNIVTSYNVSFTWNNFHIFPQEYAPYGNLWKFIRKDGLPTPLPEVQVKLVAQQLSCALEFIHGCNFVHRDIVPDNILIFQKDLSLIKISDFGSMVPARSLLTKSSSDIFVLKTEKEAETLAVSADVSPKVGRPRVNSNPNVNANAQGCGKLSYLPPEFCGILPQERYHCYPSFDVWQVGILLFACLTGGGTPWRCADLLKDQGYNHYCDWIKRKCLKTPGAFQPFSSRLMRLFKRMLEPKPTKRCRIQEIAKYLKDDWIELKKGSMINLAGIGAGLVKSPSIHNSLATATGNVARSNNAQQQKCPLKRSMTINKRRSERTVKAKRNGGGCTDKGNAGQGQGQAECQGQGQTKRREPVFRICCTFQCKNQQNQQNVRPSE